MLMGSGTCKVLCKNDTLPDATMTSYSVKEEVEISGRKCKCVKST